MSTRSPVPAPAWLMSARHSVIPENNDHLATCPLHVREKGRVAIELPVLLAAYPKRPDLWTVADFGEMWSYQVAVKRKDRSLDIGTFLSSRASGSSLY